MSLLAGSKCILTRHGVLGMSMSKPRVSSGVAWGPCVPAPALMHCGLSAPARVGFAHSPMSFMSRPTMAIHSMNRWKSSRVLARLGVATNPRLHFSTQPGQESGQGKDYSQYRLIRPRFADMERDRRRRMSEEERKQYERRQEEEKAEHERNNYSIVFYGLAVVILMAGASYAAVPLYRMFCRVTGFGGTGKEGTYVEMGKLKSDAELDEDENAREVCVSFVSETSGLPWDFVPCQNSIKVRVGESALAFFKARNRTKQAMVGVATYNVSPPRAGLYMNKVQCFCFDEQRLLPGEEVDMPVFFFIDPDFADDIRMNSIDDIVLSYTFFRSELNDDY